MSSSRLFNVARTIVRAAPRASLLRARVALPSAPAALFPRAFAAVAQGSVVQVSTRGGSRPPARIPASEAEITFGT